ncbi:MAG: invasion associated locus B family protein [Devosia sp.]
MRRRTLSGILATALICAGAAPVLAQAAPTDLGTFKAWTAWKGADEYGAICFISAAPDTSEPKEVGGKPINRDPAHFLIIHRDKAPAINADGSAAKDASGKPVFRKVRNEVQTLVGYPMKPTTDSFFHAAEIDGKAYPMKSIPDDPATNILDSEAAWLASMDDEAGFVTALKGGTKLVVKGTSGKGTKTTDTYSLAGVTAAMAAIDKACP